MIKRLKSIEQLRKEFKNYNSDGGAIYFKTADGEFGGKIIKSMFKYFGEYIDVKKYKNKRPELKFYDWRIKAGINNYYFHDDWFESVSVEFLPDDLFEI